MNDIYSEKRTILISVCDGTGRLSITGALDICMDIATMHQEVLGSGIKALSPQGLYWIIGKSRVEFIKTPELMDEVMVETWFNKPSRLFGYRQYAIKGGNGELLVRGETQWLIAGKGLKKLYPLRDFINPELCHEDNFVFEDAFPAIDKDFSGAEIIGRHIVKPTEIDFIGHMNNASYPGIILENTGLEEQRLHPVKYAVINYNRQCLEGDELVVRKREGEGHTDYCAELADGSNIMTARIIRE